MSEVKIIPPKSRVSPRTSYTQNNVSQNTSEKQQMIQRRLVLGAGVFFIYMAVGIFIQANFDKFIAYMYFLTPILLAFIAGLMYLKKKM